MGERDEAVGDPYQYEHQQEAECAKHEHRTNHHKDISIAAEADGTDHLVER